jgi:hypothetical protein
MPKPTKQTTEPPRKPRVRRQIKADPPQAKPFLRFYHSDGLRAKTLQVLATLENAKDRTRHRDELGDIVVELTECGMEYFFLRPLKLANAGFFTEQSANLGMAASTRVLASVIRNIIGRMDSPQLLSIAGYIRQLME